MLLYEPFAGCDGPTGALLARQIREHAAGGGAALILAVEASSLADLCESLYTLDHGRLATVSEPAHRIELPFKIPARQEGRVVLVNPADILYANSEEGQTCLHTSNGPVSSHLTLTELDERLAHNGFFRAHRAYLVNLQRAKAIIPYTRDSYTLVLDDPDGTEIPLSKSAARELRELLNY